MSSAKRWLEMSWHCILVPMLTSWVGYNITSSSRTLNSCGDMTHPCLSPTDVSVGFSWTYLSHIFRECPLQQRSLRKEHRKKSGVSSLPNFRRLKSWLLKIARPPYWMQKCFIENWNILFNIPSSRCWTALMSITVDVDVDVDHYEAFRHN